MASLNERNTIVFGWTLGAGDGQGGLACCGSWGHKESDTTERLNWTDLAMLSNHLILHCPVLLLLSIFPRIRVISNESVLRIRRPKYCSFSFNITPSNEYSGLIPFRIDWFDLLAVQGTLKRPLQYHNLKASVLQHSAFFMVQLSHPYMTTGKTRAFTIWSFCRQSGIFVF